VCPVPGNAPVSRFGSVFFTHAYKHKVTREKASKGNQHCRRSHLSPRCPPSITTSTNREPQFPHRQRSLISGMSPRPSAISFWRSALTLPRHDLQYTCHLKAGRRHGPCRGKFVIRHSFCGWPCGVAPTPTTSYAAVPGPADASPPRARRRRYRQAD
jgi:hypothetical protein